MLPIPESTYHALSDKLREVIRDQAFFNGSVGMDTEQGCARLTCTLIVSNTEIVPVWWEFHLYQAQGEVITDFSWSEIDKHFKAK